MSQSVPLPCWQKLTKAYTVITLLQGCHVGNQLHLGGVDIAATG